MKIQRLKALQYHTVVVLFVLALSTAGCSIRLIAPYDQKIDDGVMNLQKMTAEFLTKIERQGGSTREDYKNHTTFYDCVKVTLSGLIVRASAIAKNDLTVQQLEVLSDHYFNDLEKHDREMGITLPWAAEYKKTFNQIFIAILTLEEAKKEPTAGGGTTSEKQPKKSGGTEQ